MKPTDYWANKIFLSTFLSKLGLLFPFKVDLVQLKLGGGPSGGPADGGDGDIASVTDEVSDERRENNEGDDSAKYSENWDI